jgi:hypothetical protein
VNNTQYKVIGLNADLARGVKSATQKKFDIGEVLTLEDLVVFANDKEYNVVTLMNSKILYLLPPKVQVKGHVVHASILQQAHLVAKPI